MNGIHKYINDAKKRGDAEEILKHRAAAAEHKGNSLGAQLGNLLASMVHQSNEEEEISTDSE